MVSKVIEQPADPAPNRLHASSGDRKPEGRKSGYHHGELPATLMALALAHIEAAGTEKLSLRALAREAGVSATAPYRHFPTKQCLLAALATQGFQKLSASIVQAIDKDAPSSETMIAMGVGYIDFATNNPTTYNLMFGSVLGDFSRYDMLHNAASNSYDAFKSVLLAVIKDSEADIDVERLGGVSWSFIHGMASLLINHPNIGDASSSPMRAIAALQADPEAAVRLMFGDLLNRSLNPQ